jgi:hypothetical protein
MFTSMGFFDRFRRKKAEYLSPSELSFTQLDITERFDEHLNLTKEEWITTTPLNSFVTDSPGLPLADASAGEIYAIAQRLSEIREQFQLDDGVYCPICHIANVDNEKLRIPCPKCGRELLAFGWT